MTRIRGKSWRPSTCVPRGRAYGFRVLGESVTTTTSAPLVDEIFLDFLNYSLVDDVTSDSGSNGTAPLMLGLNPKSHPFPFSLVDILSLVLGFQPGNC